MKNSLKHAKQKRNRISRQFNKQTKLLLHIVVSTFYIYLIDILGSCSFHFISILFFGIIATLSVKDEIIVLWWLLNKRDDIKIRSHRQTTVDLKTQFFERKEKPNRTQCKEGEKIFYVKNKKK